MKLQALFEAYFSGSQYKSISSMKNFSTKKSLTQQHGLRIWMIDFHTIGAISGVDGQASSYKKFSDSQWKEAIEFADLKNCTDIRITKAADNRSSKIGDIRKGTDCIYAIPPANPEHGFEVKEPELTVKEMIAKVKAIQSKIGDWKISAVVPGSHFTEQNKKIAITVELKRKFSVAEVQSAVPNEKYANPHEILIQGEYYNSPAPAKSRFKPKKTGHLDYWLNQGNVINFGAKAPTFNNGDIESFLEALIDATKPNIEKKVIQELYKSGYHKHGRN